jgi:hypothetical protein
MRRIRPGAVMGGPTVHHNDIGNSSLKKGAIVTYNNEGTGPVVEKFLKNAKCVEIEVVGRFIE